MSEHMCLTFLQMKHSRNSVADTSCSGCAWIGCTSWITRPWKIWNQIVGLSFEGRSNTCLDTTDYTSARLINFILSVTEFKDFNYYVIHICELPQTKLAHKLHTLENPRAPWRWSRTGRNMSALINIQICNRLVIDLWGLEFNQ